MNKHLPWTSAKSPGLSAIAVSLSKKGRLTGKACKYLANNAYICKLYDLHGCMTADQDGTVRIDSLDLKVIHSIFVL